MGWSRTRSFFTLLGIAAIGLVLPSALLLRACDPCDVTEIARMSSGGIEFRVIGNDCGAIAKTSEFHVVAGSSNGDILLFAYDPVTGEPPSITATRDRIVIATPTVNQILFKRPDYNGRIIELEIGKVIYPGSSEAR